MDEPLTDPLKRGDPVTDTRTGEQGQVEIRYVHWFREDTYVVVTVSGKEIYRGRSELHRVVREAL